MSHYEARKAAWESALAVQSRIRIAGNVLVALGLTVFLAPLAFKVDFPDWSVVPAVVAGIGFLMKLGAMFHHVPPMPASPYEEARRSAEQAESLPRRLAQAQSTDTPKDTLRTLAQSDASPEVRRAAIETLALLNQAGL
ncbi:hypothetical protein [Microcella sp.]|uniref:hypothetical protein n=1 Tax=Microcella sp. TaxID=1913979 RepID=UPI00391CFB54